MEDKNREMTETREKRRKVNTYRISKVVFNLVLMVLGAVIIAVFLRNIQTRTSLAKQKDNSELALSEVVSIMERNDRNTDTLTGIYHEGNWKTLDDINELFDGGLFDRMMASDLAIRCDVFSDISTQAGVPYLYLLSMEGKVVLSPDPQLIGRNPATTAILTQENLNRLLEFCRDGQGNVTPVYVENRYGSFYFYSQPYTYRNTQYALVLGADSWALDVHIASLRDVSTVMSRMSVINDGFLFAIDPESKMFVYYHNGEDMLTGRNIFECGLNQEITSDGFQGRQTILGDKYYCISRAYGDDMIVVAAANYDKVISHDKYVLVWSLLGFTLVMILCLTYAIIVRNDFIRQGVQNEKKELFGKSRNPLYFDTEVFRKVRPLMLIGIIAVYFISFYTQTLLEINEGIDRSNVIIQEITGRYEESQESRKVIEEYYDSRFLSTARIIKFILEESPDILNETSDHYYSYIDNDGNRQFILDDEYNPLKSVGQSAALQQLCNENRIDAIYVFDEDGRTIATNTKNWFFTLSNNPEDQSYPFRKVLDGDVDSFLQTHMVNDIGEESQFFGVALNYYTASDSRGNTIYVSRYAFEKSCQQEGVSGVRSAGGITRHHSLLQIELDEALAGSILETTSAEYALATKMLADGAIIMFDNSPEHLCVYSPSASSIGKSAGQMGVSAKAFSSDIYYGFNTINGIEYFQYFRFIDNYYIATAIPRTSMFTTRTTIALTTAGVCMALILILLLTVTLTNKEEEMLYADLIDQDANLNSTFFNVILPSGRVASTTKAVSRWDNRHIPWSERSAEMKLAAIISWIIMILVLYFVLSAVGISRFADEDSVIRYILSNGWDRSLNIFAVSACIMVLAMTVIAIELFRIPVRLITALLGTRGETVGHLLLSIVKYGGSIAALFYSLYLVGIDSGNLLASAGILSLVIGLGAQSLIKDILAGIFIVFEGEFRVGDIVTINGFRGVVTDIGLRTTKILGEGNIKIYNNSEISGVLNMTKETSVAFINIGMDYSQDPSFVEQVLELEMPLLKLKNRRILDGPKYMGISELADRKYTMTIMARCAEADVRSVTRYLNKELLEIFRRNGIKGPGQVSAAPTPPVK